MLKSANEKCINKYKKKKKWYNEIIISKFNNKSITIAK